MVKVMLLDGRNGFIQMFKLQFVYMFKLAFIKPLFWISLILVDGERDMSKLWTLFFSNSLFAEAEPVIDRWTTI